MSGLTDSKGSLNKVLENSSVTSNISSQEYEDDQDSISAGLEYSGVHNAKIYAKYYSSTFRRLCVFFSLFLMALAYGLDHSVRNTYQTLATSSFSNNSRLSTINCIEQVLSAASEIWFARAADMFGRPFVFVTTTLAYVVGTVIQCQSYNLASYAIGSCIFAIGHSGLILCCEVYVADFSNLNWRVTAGAGQILPNVIITWVGGNIAGAVGDNWKWGIGMWAFIYPLSCIPFAFCVLHMYYLARKNNEQLMSIFSKRQGVSIRQFCTSMFFWKLDFIGLVLLVLILALILIPLTLGGGVTDKWRTPGILVPEILGWVVAFPLYVWWEYKYATHPLMPWKVVKDRGVWSPLAINLFMEFVFAMQSTYMTTFLLVAVNQSKKTATRINRLWSFVSVLVAFFFGFIVVKIRRTKELIIVGICAWFVSFGLLEHFRGGDGSFAGIIVAECMLGLGNGFLKFPSKTSIQACVLTHEMMALATSLTLALNSIGTAFAAAVAGAIWSNVLPKRLEELFPDDIALAKAAFKNPVAFIKKYHWNTVERQNVVLAYRTVQRILMSVALGLIVPLLISSFFLRNRRLEDVVALDELEGKVDEVEVSTEEVNQIDKIDKA